MNNFAEFMSQIDLPVLNKWVSGVQKIHSKWAPDHWTAKGILIDELRGESEELEEIEIGGRKVHVNWIAPLSEAEVQFILAHGIEEFDKRVDHSDQSIVDPTRISNLIDWAPSIYF